MLYNVGRGQAYGAVDILQKSRHDGSGGRGSTAVSRRRGRQNAAYTRGRGSEARMKFELKQGRSVASPPSLRGSCDDHRTAVSRKSWRQRWWGAEGQLTQNMDILCKREAGDVFADECGRVADGRESARHTGTGNLVVHPGALSMLTDGTRQEELGPQRYKLAAVSSPVTVKWHVFRQLATALLYIV